MTQLMQEYSGQKEQGEDAHGHSRVAGQDQKYRLDFAMQKPLKHDQRHKHENEPDEAGELGHDS